MTATVKPIGQRKLNREIRYKMAVLAAERFRSPGLRVIETAARDHLRDILIRDAKAIPAKEIKVLDKHGFVARISAFDLPQELYVPTPGTRTFTLPDGTEVTRDGAGKPRHIYEPGDDRHELPSFPSWSDATYVTPERTSRGYGGEALKLGTTIDLPSSNRELVTAGFQKSNTKNGEEAAVSKIWLQHVKSEFMSPDVLPAMQAYFVAGDARICAERRLICTAIKIIASCTVYSQVTDFWPEVREIEEDLFSGSIPSAFALVVLSDDDKAFLCANLGERNVESATCARLAA